MDGREWKGNCDKFEDGDYINDVANENNVVDWSQWKSNNIVCSINKFYKEPKRIKWCCVVKMR